MEVGEKLARFSFLGKDPLYTFTAKGRHVEIRGKERRDIESDPLVELQAFMDRFRGVDNPDLPPFSGGAVGFVCYDAIRLVENIPASGKDDFHLPDLHFGFYESFLVFDHIKHKLSIVSNVLTDEFPTLEAAYASAVSKIEQLEADLAKPLPAPEHVSSGPAKWESNFTQDGFKAGVEKCKEYIRAGDAFQIVLSQRFSTKPAASPLAIYRALRSINPSPYMYYLDYGDFEIVGASPETLVKVQNGLAETKPVAGTLSGAPKIRAMEIIDGLEPHRRGLYGGAICYMDFRGNLDSCIAIRTMLIRDGIAYVQAGGGIVADSDPQTEFEETQHKARALMRAVDAAGRI